MNKTAKLRRKTLACPRLFLAIAIVSICRGVAAEPGEATAVEPLTEADRAYWRKLYWVAAARDAPQRYPALDNFDASQLGLGALRRRKSGTAGLDRLTIEKSPVAEAVMTQDEVNRWSLRLGDTDLFTGDAAPNALIGSVPLSPQPFTVSPQAHSSAGVEPYVRFDRDGVLASYLELGNTPRDGPLGSRALFRLGFVGQRPNGFWNPEVFSEPVRESVLSYVGTVDPYTGGYWGRVTREGIGVVLYEQLSRHWGVYGNFRHARYRGTGVAENRGTSFALSLGRGMSNARFDYFSVGPYFNYITFDDNLSHFTLGHGGYFSPQRFTQLGVSANFLTREGRPYVVRGFLSLGYERIHEDSAPFFPVAPDGRRHAGNEDTNIGSSLELLGVKRLSGRWQLGMGVAWRDNPSYNDRFGLLFLRYLSMPRPAVFSTDLPTNLFRDLF